MFDYVILDSGVFCIVAMHRKKLRFYFFPTNHEYLEMMSAADLFLHYAPSVIERLRSDVSMV